MTNPSPKSVLKKYPSGNIFQLFGENKSDYSPLGYSGGHPGIDITAYQGAPLVAVCDSVVQEIAPDPTRLGGRAVWIYANGVRYGYGHLDSICVSVGQQLKAGDLIGTMGNSGFIISGNTKFWGNAPAGKGVHCHFSKMYVTMDGDTPNIINSDNGYKGFVDPLPDLVDGSIKAEIPDTRVPLLKRLVELYRELILSLGGKPNA